MSKRFNDVPYNTFSTWSDIVVVCPNCGKAGVVCFDKQHNTAIFRCQSCYMEKKIIVGNNEFKVNAQCMSTGKYFKISVPSYKVHGQKVRVKCPYCEEFVIGDVLKEKQQCVVFEDIHHGKDPYFHYPLYYQTSYREKMIWALNKEHLQYLIDYLSADLRTVQSDFHTTYKTMRSQSDMLPTFMKTAKNREGIVKLLTKLLEK